MEHACNGCGKPIPRVWPNGIPVKPSHYETKRYCQMSCYLDVLRKDTPSGCKGRTQDRLIDIMELLNFGESPCRIPQRLNPPSNPRAVSRWLHRHQQHELARIFERAERETYAA